MQQNPLKINGFFITGSDTDVGKTWIGCQLIHQLKSQVSSLKVRKPVESGCELQADKQLIPADGTALFKANDGRESLQLITPLRFKAAVSPDRAAKLENQNIFLSQLYDAVMQNIHAEDFLLVEGAGGFFSPIAEDGLNSDLAKLLKLPVIVVIEDRLGAINQGLLAIKAIESEGLQIKAVILNQTHEPLQDNDQDNLTDLSKRTKYPVYYASYNGFLAAIDLF